MENAIAMAVFLTNCLIGEHGKVIELITEPRGLAKVINVSATTMLGAAAPCE